jgi:hypothetical protein
MNTDSARRLTCRTSLLLAPLLAGGCSRAPSIDVLGSFFPSWLVCFIVAVLLTTGAHFAAVRLRIKVVYPLLIYPSLLALLTFALWLIFFL